MALNPNHMEEALEAGLEGFWKQVVEFYRSCGVEPKSGDVAPTQAYDLENYARNALENWVNMNLPKTKHYVQRTTVQVIEVLAIEADHAMDIGRNLDDSEWADIAIDTERDYVVLDASGKQCC